MTKAPRTSRPLKRKTSHSVIERRRREKINEGLIHLQNTIPACRLELQELLLCKAKNNKANIKKSDEEMRAHVENLMKEKSGSEMVLEKLVNPSFRLSYGTQADADVHFTVHHQSYSRLCPGTSR
jgi:hypothetical protein